MNMNRTPFDRLMLEDLKIRRPDSRVPFGRDVRGQFTAAVKQWRFGYDDDLGINTGEVFFRVTVDAALPEASQNDSTLPFYKQDVRDNDHLIRLKFYSDDEIDTDAKLRQVKKRILQIVNIEVYAKADQTLLICKELGTL